MNKNLALALTGTVILSAIVSAAFFLIDLSNSFQTPSTIFYMSTIVMSFSTIVLIVYKHKR